MSDAERGRRHNLVLSALSVDSLCDPGQVTGGMSILHPWSSWNKILLRNTPTHMHQTQKCGSKATPGYALYGPFEAWRSWRSQAPKRSGFPAAFPGVPCMSRSKQPGDVWEYPSLRTWQPFPSACLIPFFATQRLQHFPTRQGFGEEGCKALKEYRNGNQARISSSQGWVWNWDYLSFHSP